MKYPDDYDWEQDFEDDVEKRALMFRSAPVQGRAISTIGLIVLFIIFMIGAAILS